MTQSNEIAPRMGALDQGRRNPHRWEANAPPGDGAMPPVRAEVGSPARGVRVYPDRLRLARAPRPALTPSAALGLAADEQRLERAAATASPTVIPSGAKQPGRHVRSAPPARSAPAPDREPSSAPSPEPAVRPAPPQPAPPQPAATPQPASRQAPTPQPAPPPTPQPASEPTRPPRRSGAHRRGRHLARRPPWWRRLLDALARARGPRCHMCGVLLDGNQECALGHPRG